MSTIISSEMAILTVLLTGPAYSRAIVTKISSWTDEEVRPDIKTIHMYLLIMLKNGWIKRAEKLNQPDKPTAPIYYELTEAGLRLAMDYKLALRKLLAAGEANSSFVS